MKRTYTTMLALAMTALAPVTYANSETPGEQVPPPEATPAAAAPTAAADEAKMQEEAEKMYAQAEAKAETMTWEQVKPVISLMLGFETGSTLANDLPGIKVADINQALFMQAMKDSLKNEPQAEYADKDMGAYAFAVQKLYGGVETPEGLTPEQQTMFDKAMEGSKNISREDALNFLSYLTGYQTMQLLGSNAPTLTVDDVDTTAFFKGMAAGTEQKLPEEMNDRLKVAACVIVLDKEINKRLEATSKANLEAGQAFLTENGKKAGVVTTASGLQYKVITAGSGEKYDEAKHGANAECSVTYEGRLINGDVFDATTTPVSFPINGVVPGFSEALKLMPVGSEWEIYIPAQLGYGERGPAAIGSNATLIFKVKLVDIKEGRGSAGNPIELTPEMLEQLKQQGLMDVTEQLPQNAPADK